MLRIEQSYTIKATPDQVWRALTEPALIQQWTGAAAEYDGRLGGRYRLWDDYVTGQVVEWDPPRKLAQTWQPNDWIVEGSVVRFELSPIRGGTRLDLIHEKVDPADYEGTSEGWKTFFIGSIKKLLEAKNQAPSKARKKHAARKRASVKKKTASDSKLSKPLTKRKRRKGTAVRKRAGA